MGGVFRFVIVHTLKNRFFEKGFAFWEWRFERIILIENFPKIRMKEEGSFVAVMGGNIDGQVSVYEIEMSNSKNFPTMTILFIFFFWLIFIHVSDLYPFPFILVMLVTAKRRCRAAIPGQIGAQIKFASLRLLFLRPTESLEGSNYKSPLKRGCPGSS